MRVEVYRNLRKDCLSVRPLPSGTGGVFHFPGVILRDATFAVQPAGRAKVLRDKQKNVHAFVRGQLVSIAAGSDFDDHATAFLNRAGVFEVTYNPYLYETFVRRSSEAPVYGAASVMIIGKEIFAYSENRSR